MAKLWVYLDPPTPHRRQLGQAFSIPDEWLRGWSELGFERSFRFVMPRETPTSPAPVAGDALLTIPTVTVEMVKAYRNEVPVPHIVLLGGGRWLIGHPAVKELEHAHSAPV